MTTDYNAGQTARQYKKAKEQPWRLRVETYSFMKLIGDLQGKQVVDLACGEGHFTRRLRQAGAANVVGEDISERMIALARAQEAEEPLGIEYRVEDARTLTPQQDFDLAVSAWLLVYARDRAELASMCQGLGRRLRPGGRFVTFTSNPDVYSFQPPPDYRKYGFDMRLAERVYEGAPIIWKILLDDAPLEIENYYLPISAYESAFRDAGFRDFAVHGLELAPDAEAGDDRAFWADMLNYPPAIMMECVKQ
ncbi:MAG TPA: class I SAM-dependent methyltransferase [Pirellulales bacterium]|nr:class I SAM-dependent methyltransferase [Pirellulales bacterium]